MGCNADVVVAGITFLPPTSVLVFTVEDVNGATVQAFPFFSACLAGSMECQALGAVKGEVATMRTDCLSTGNHKLYDEACSTL